MASPVKIPINRFVKIITATVTIKGTNCVQPKLNIFLNKDGFANLKPTIINTAAKTDLGM